MRNNRIKGNSPSKFFNNASQIFSPSSTSRHDLDINAQSNGIKDTQKQGKRTQNILGNMKIKFLLNSLVKKLRYLTPPSITPSNVQEQWQNQAIQDKISTEQSNYAKQTLSDQLNHKYQVFRHLNSIQGIVSIMVCWIITTSIVFQQKFGQQIFLLCLALTTIRIVLIFSFAIKQKKQQSQNYWTDILGQDLLNPLLLLSACVLFLILNGGDTGPFQYIIQGVSFLIVLIEYRHIGNYFHNIVRYAQQNKKNKQLRIIELFGLIFTLAHCFALIMYGMTLLNPSKQSWLDKARLTQQNWSIQYIYSFYWAITTMVTVGYGDLTPQNQIQVVFVVSIQIVGTAIFGYMINVIGLTVDQIKKKNQQFQNYQSTIGKLRDHYKLSRQLCHRMKHDIKLKENQLKNIPLKTTQQKQFLQYIQPNLKEQFVLQTNMKVIKKSIFFLTHFSVNFQNQIALKLIRIIYKPQEEITTVYNLQERNLVIINNGSVDIFYQMHHNNIQIKKKVRTIKPSQQNLTMNVFGYSSLIMHKNIKLKAIAKQSVASYVLLRKDILQCIQKNMLDFQSFNEMRQKMIQYQRIQQIQAPQLKESQFHYAPNIFVLQKKITYQNQPRANCRRERLKRKFKLITAKNYEAKTLPKIQEQKIETIGYINEDDFHSLISFDAQKNQGLQLISKDETFLGRLQIDQCKIFENFMKSSNLPIVAIAYEKSCQKKSYRKRFSTSAMAKPGTFLIKKRPL